MPATTLLEPETSSFILVVRRSIAAYHEKPGFISMMEREISKETENLSCKYSVFFDQISEIILRISPRRYEGISGHGNLILDLTDLIDVCINFTSILGEESLQKTEDEDSQWIVGYLVRSIRKILVRMRDNIYSFYSASRDSEDNNKYRRRLLTYIEKQMIDVLELYALWEDVMSSESMEPEEILDTIGQKLYSSVKSKP